EVTDATSDVLLECALFDPRAVRRTARGLGMSTDASYRFERGVDPELQPLALRRVVDLILSVAGGEVVRPGVDVHPGRVERTVVELRPARAERVLGVPVPPEDVSRLLEPIGFAVANGGEKLRVTVPGARPDVTREIAVTEEL